MVRAIERGLSLKDFEILTIGQIIGYITEYNNLRTESVEDKVREATQSDYESF
ncbi:MAG: hypothetical protein IBX70_13485 [Clostridia bacterium]|nr:hypothetical protein [Clostridia bacterium]